MDNFKRYNLLKELRRLKEEYEKTFKSNIIEDYDNYIYDGFSGINLCTECGRDMGDINGRQLCRKTYCELKK